MTRVGRDLVLFTHENEMVKVTRHVLDAPHLFAGPVLGQALFEGTAFRLFFHDNGLVRASGLTKLTELLAGVVHVRVRGETILHAALRRAAAVPLMGEGLSGPFAGDFENGATRVLRGTIVNFRSELGARMTKLADQRFVGVTYVSSSHVTVIEGIPEHSARMQRRIQSTSGAGDGRFAGLVVHKEG